MPLDGTIIAGVVNELSLLVGGRIDKIAQPESDEILLTVRAKGSNHKLLITANSSAPRLNFTAQNKQNPMQAPMFCMVLRKHLSGGRITGIIQPEFERIVEFNIDALDEMGDRSEKKLIIEIMGKHSNIMLVGPEGKILDAIKHIPPSVSSVRPILPGVAYSRPPGAGKSSPLAVAEDDFFADFEQGVSAHKALFQRYTGISPVLASEICARAGVLPDICPVGHEEKERLYTAFSHVFARVTAGEFECKIYFDNNKAVDLAALPLTIYSRHHAEAYESPSAMLEAFYSRREEAYRLGQKTADLRKLIAAQLERCRKKSFMYEKTLEEIKNRDELRVRGELLTAYLYMIESGSDSFTAENFYDNNKPLTIPLDPSLAPAENAQRYFKRYNKQKRTFAALREQIEKNKSDLAYLESVAASVEAAADEADIAEIRAELAEQGFVKRRAAKNKKAAEAKPLRFTTSDDFEIYVGKNNTQNDELTLRFARAGDTWLHAKDIAGSHVIIVTGGKEPSETAILEAANLAAYFSRARTGSQVPVDYTSRKNVRKPAGAKPGFVIYDHHRTVYVTPVER